jgi:hypothetical protein
MFSTSGFIDRSYLYVRFGEEVIIVNIEEYITS